MPVKAMKKASTGGVIKVMKRMMRARYIRQKAKMSSETWKKQWNTEEMDQQWLCPAYTDIPQPGKSHTAYRDETYITITRWTKDTKIQYRPHAKAPGSKSHNRYEKYSRARTVGEALKLGTFPADWCHDYEHGFIRVTGGKVREEALDVSEVEVGDLTEVDAILAKWFQREAAKILGISRQKAGEEGAGAVLLRMRRMVAEKKAVEILSECEKTGRKVNDTDVLEVLRRWGFKKNDGRVNVIPTGSTFVLSDTLGVVSDRKGCCAPTAHTLAYPRVPQLLNKYVQEHAAPGLQNFTYTSINVNKNYAGRLHRDGSNVGPSILKAFGRFTGGKTTIYPNDDRTINLEDEGLPKSDATTVDVSKNLLLFDGRRAHFVHAFSGERFSLVFFTCPRYKRVTTKSKNVLKNCGFKFPDTKTAKLTLSLLASPRGYSNKLKSIPRAKPQYMAWPVVAKLAAKLKGRSVAKLKKRVAK